MGHTTMLALLIIAAACPLWGLVLAWSVRLLVRAGRRAGAVVLLAIGLLSQTGCASYSSASVTSAPVPSEQPGYAVYACIEEHFDARYVGGDARVVLVRAALAAPAIGRNASDFDAERLDGGAAPGKLLGRESLAAVPAPRLTPTPGQFTRPEVRAAIVKANAVAQAASAAALSRARTAAHRFADGLFAKAVTRSLPGSDYGACLSGAGAFFAAHPHEQPYLLVFGRLVAEGAQTPVTAVSLHGARVQVALYCEQTAVCPARRQAFLHTLGQLGAGPVHFAPPEDLPVLLPPWQEQW